MSKIHFQLDGLREAGIAYTLSKGVDRLKFPSNTAPIVELWNVAQVEKAYIATLVVVVTE